MLREGYEDTVRLRRHALVLADALELLPTHDNGGWPTVPLMPVLPSARDLIVRALREIAQTLPEE